MNRNISRIGSELGNSSDLSISISASLIESISYASLYIDNMVDKNGINSLSSEITELSANEVILKGLTPSEYFDAVTRCVSSFRKYQEGSNIAVLCDEIISGKTIFLVDGCDRFLAIETFSPEGRAVEEPTTQSVIRGPKEGFTENLGTNISLIRKRIRDKALRVESLSLGSRTNTKVCLMYIDRIAKGDVVDEVRRRLNEIKIDGVLDSGYIEEFIKDDRFSLFPEFLNSEKPDSVTAALLEGRVAILVDGTAYVLTAPAFFVEFLQASEDYYHQFMVSSMVRIIRYTAFFLTIFVPALYISLVTFHQEMIPTPLLISIAAQREGVPFPALVEAMFMEGVFEILREAGIRMPRVIGPAISIVGALVIGQATVEAGIVSAVMVIIVSITAISSFAIPNYALSNAARIIKFSLMILAGIFGLYGVFMGFIFMVLHLCKLKSIGEPYMIPFAPKIKRGNRDTILRYPMWGNRSRPKATSATEAPRTGAEDPVAPYRKKKPEFR